MINTGEIEANTLRVRDVTRGLSPGDLAWRPSPGSWSIAECIAHLNATNARYALAIEAGVGQARRRRLQGPAPVQHGWLERLMLKNMEPPVKRRFRAPRAFLPASNEGLDTLMREWDATHHKLLELAAGCHDLNVNRVKVPSPANSLMRIRLGSAFAILAAHDRRHLWQAEQVRSAMERARTASA
jgi:hypothetical protein